MKKGLVIFFFLHFIFLNSKASEYPGNQVHCDIDSIVIVSGHILDSLTYEGIDSACIFFEELPYGNYIEIFYSRTGDGFYEFKTFGHDAYRIKIQANTFQSVVDTLYPIKNGENGFIVKNYVLSREPAEEVITLENLIFDLGKSEIKPESFKELDNLVKLMKENPDMVIQLEGHTDFRGGKSKNRKLSEDRVREVKNYLIQGGIMPDRILTLAYGGSKPLSWEASEEASRLNRRVEVRIIKR
jgi:outer membrane protein OmpA-like peptidoglycan-associated protein